MKKLIIQLLSSLIKSLLKIAPPAVANAAKNDLLSKLDTYTAGYNSITFRPKTANQIDLDSVLEPMNEKIAIVIQGPIVEEDSFTLETVKIYAKNYPNHIIIVSTWDDIKTELVQSLEEIGSIVVLSEKPKNFGSLNINLQIVSSKNGILKAKELGCTFVYKTRTDQRFYATDISHYLLDVLKKDPILEKLGGQKYRLISSSMTTLKYRPYGLGDMFMFGFIDDMLLYWDSKLDNRNIKREDIPVKSVLETAKLKLAETYLCTNYLDKIEYDYNFTLVDSWKVYGTFFYIVDFEKLNLFWYKYDWRNESRFEYFRKNTFELLSEKDSVLLSLENGNVCQEEILNKKEGAKV